MKKLTTAEAFGSETAFTAAICHDKSLQSQLNNFLVDKLNFDLDLDSIKYIPEVQLDFGCRPDIVVEQYKEPSLVIECMDARGNLDMPHIMKSIAYAYQADVTNIVLLAEEISVDAVRLVEHLREFGHSMYLVTYDIFQVDDKIFVFFRSNCNPMQVPVETPRRQYQENAKEKLAELQSEFYSKYKERLGLDRAKMYYCSRNTYANMTIYANIRAQKSNIEIATRKFDLNALEADLSKMFSDLEVATIIDKSTRSVRIKGFTNENHLVETFAKICDSIDTKTLEMKKIAA